MEKDRDSVTWLLFSVITVSLGIAVLPSFIWTYVDDWCVCGGLGFLVNLGLMASCAALLGWQIRKHRGTAPLDPWVPISLGVILFSAILLGLCWIGWTATESQTGYWFLLPGAVALLGYIVLALRLEKGTPRALLGMPLLVLLPGLGTVSLLLWFLAPIGWPELWLSMALGILVAGASVAGMSRLGLSGPSPQRRNTLVFFLILALVGLVGVCLASQREANLSGQDLRGAKLNRANLSGFDLSQTNLRRSNLSRANLTDALLRDANLGAANLRGADLTRADLTGASLRWADLRGANLAGADLTGADLTGTDLSRADLTGATVTAGQLAQSETLEGATMPDGSVHE